MRPLIRSIPAKAFVIAAVIAMVAVTWGYWGAQDTQAGVQAKTQMDIVITHSGGQCFSATQSKCTMLIGSSFTVSIVPSTIPVGGYTAWQETLDYGSLLYKPAASAANEIKWDLEFLQVRSPSNPTGKEGQVVHADVSSILPPFPVSTQKTSFVNLAFNCFRNAGGPFSQVLSLEPQGTAYTETDGSTPNFPNVGSIKINCVEEKTEISLSAHGPKVRCDGLLSQAKGEVPKPEKCDVLVGEPFTLSIEINAAPSAGYTAVQTEIDYGVLAYKKGPSAADEVVLPGCPIALRAQQAGQVGHGCAALLGEKLNFVGNIVELLFNCTTDKSSNSIDLIPFPSAFVGTVFFEFGTNATIVPNVDSLGINCVNSVKLPKPGDTDGDGCADVHENRPKDQADQGGGRDWQDPNDYYDVYGPGQSLVLDGVIDLPNDILGVIQHYAPQGQAPYDVRFDRGQQIGVNHWQLGPPDGVIDLPNDILGVVFQFGHTCV